MNINKCNSFHLMCGGNNYCQQKETGVLWNEHFSMSVFSLPLLLTLHFHFSMWLHFLKVKVNSGPGPGKIGHICISFPQVFPVYHIFRTIKSHQSKNAS